MKQGGVLSAILFGVYINSSLYKLEHSRGGCYIGHIFMGAFGYADDIILLAPSKKSLCVLLDICKQFSLEFQVNFNLSKSKLIVFSNANDCDTSVLFNNQMISSVSSEQHLGHIIGNQVSQECIKSITNDFFKRVNVYAVFKFTFSETKYFLFKVFVCFHTKVYCGMFSSKHVEMFYTIRRKCIRRLLGLPYRTHNNLLHLICNDIPVDGQLHLRFLNFFVNNLKSDNTCVKLCALLCLRGSRSEASKSLYFITNLFSMDKYNIVDSSFTNTIIDVNSPISADMMSAAAINDVLCMRDQKTPTLRRMN